MSRNRRYFLFEGEYWSIGRASWLKLKEWLADGNQPTSSDLRLDFNARILVVPPRSERVLQLPIKYKYCTKCGLGEAEYMSCEEPDCGELK